MFVLRYNQIDSGEDAQEEFGWKLVHGDVFRPPRKGMLLSVFLGSGTQVKKHNWYKSRVHIS